MIAWTRQGRAAAAAAAAEASQVDPRTGEPVGDGGPSPRERVLEFERALDERRRNAMDGAADIARVEHAAAQLVERGRDHGRTLGERRAAALLERAHEQADLLREQTAHENAELARHTAQCREQDVEWLLARVIPQERVLPEEVER